MLGKIRCLKLKWFFHLAVGYLFFWSMIFDEIGDVLAFLKYCDCFDCQRLPPLAYNTSDEFQARNASFSFICMKAILKQIR
jgi:hypothetical protein